MENRLAAERAKRGWSQVRMAELAGISRQSYASIEQGASVPSTEIALKLADGLGSSVEELFRVEAGPALERGFWLGSGAARIGGRARVARASGRTVAVDAGRGRAALADAVIRSVHGEEVDLEMLPERPAAASLVVAGCDPAFGMVVDRLRAERGIEVVWILLNSSRALDAVATGRAHIAGIHPGWADPTDRAMPFASHRVAFADWEQGLVVEAGNPLGITGIQDLARPHLRLANREVGSGTRALLESSLRGTGIDPTGIQGYGSHAPSHLAVAESVASGLADVGVAIRSAAAAFGMEMVPLRRERYDLIIPDAVLDLDATGAVLDALRHRGLRRQIESLGGYDTAAMGDMERFG